MCRWCSACSGRCRLALVGRVLHLVVRPHKYCHTSCCCLSAGIFCCLLIRATGSLAFYASYILTHKYVHPLYPQFVPAQPASHRCHRINDTGNDLNVRAAGVARVSSFTLRHVHHRFVSASGRPSLPPPPPPLPPPGRLHGLPLASVITMYSVMSNINLQI
jgi:hypothetical protein